MARIYAPVAAPLPQPPKVGLIEASILPTQAALDDVDKTLAVILEGINPADEQAIGEAQAEAADARAGIRADAMRWTGGFEYLPENQASAVVRDPCDNSSMGDTNSSEPAIVQFDPFLVVVEVKCSSFGWSAFDYLGRARRMLDLATPSAVENEFWSGTLATAKSWPNNFLVNNSAPNFQDLTPLAGAPSVLRGLQIVEDALVGKGSGGQGMIHCEVQTAPNLLGARRVNQLLLTLKDNVVVAGAGYPGTAPGGGAADAGTSWIYGTDLTAVRIDDEVLVTPDNYAEALDRATNTLRFRAQRFAAVTFDGYRQFACQVTLAD